MKYNFRFEFNPLPDNKYKIVMTDANGIPDLRWPETIIKEEYMGKAFLLIKQNPPTNLLSGMKRLHELSKL